MRSGWDSNSIVAIEAGKLLEDIGIQAITLHARTTKQSYSGFSDWNLIKELKKELTIPVIGNGDVNSVEAFDKITNLTKCDAVMIGRGALGTPWIFEEVIANMNGMKFKKPSILDVTELCKEHISLLEENKSIIASVNLSKKHLNFYLKDFQNSSYWRKKIMLCDNTSKMKEILNQLYNENK